MAKIVEAGLAAEPVQFAAEGPILTQTSSRTHVGGNSYEERDGDLTRIATGEDAKIEKLTSADGDKTPDVPANEATLMHGIKLYLVFAAMMLGVFMFALDQSVGVMDNFHSNHLDCRDCHPNLHIRVQRIRTGRLGHLWLFP